MVTDHESECKAVEGARSGIIHAVSPCPQLHKPHQRGETGVDVSQVPQDCRLEPRCSARHTDITLNACTEAQLHMCQRPPLDFVEMLGGLHKLSTSNTHLQLMNTAKIEYQYSWCLCGDKRRLTTVLAARLG